MNADRRQNRLRGKLSTVGTALEGARRLSASSQSGGTAQWSVDLESPVTGSPTIVDETVYVGTEDGVLHVRSADDGSSEWTFDAGGPIAVAPTVLDGTVFLGCNDGPNENLYALDAAGGDVQWSVSHLGWHTASPPTIHRGTLVALVNDGTVYGFDPATGDELWSASPDGGVLALPCVADGLVYVSTTGPTTYALDVESGEIQWSEDTSTTVSTAATVAEGTAFFGEGRALETDATPALHAVDAETGQQSWRRGEIEYVGATQTVHDGTVYVSMHVPQEGDLRALSVDDATQQWAFDPYARVEVAPTVAAGRVYISTTVGSTYAVDANEGSETWRFDTETPVTTHPIVADGTLYLGTDGGTLVAVATDHDRSSEGSRVRLATHGHHEGWAGEASARTPEGTTGGASSGGAGSDAGPDGGNDGSLPGPGIVGAITSLAGAGYLLGRRADDDSSKARD